MLGFLTVLTHMNWMQYAFIVLLISSCVVLCPRIVKIITLYIWDGADMRSPFTLSSVFVFLSSLVLILLSMTKISTNLSFTSFMNNTAAIIGLSTIYGRLWGFPTSKKYNFKQLQSVVITIAFFMLLAIQFFSLSFTYQESVLTYDIVEAAKARLHPNGSVPTVIIFSILSISIVGSIIAYDKKENRTKRTMIYDSLLLAVPVLLMFVNTLKYWPVMPDDVKMFVIMYIRDPVLIVSTILPLLFLHKETQSIIRRSSQSLLKATFVIDEFTHLYNSYKECKDDDKISPYFVRKALSVNSNIKQDAVLDDLIRGKFGGRHKKTAPLYELVKHIDTIDTTEHLRENSEHIKLSSLMATKV